MRNELKLVVIAALAATAPSAVHAAVKVEEKSDLKFEGTLGKVVHLFGGGGESARSVAVRGNRMASMSDTTGQIVDLDEGKVYSLDVKQKTYTEATFEELRRRMEDARRKAESEAGRQKRDGGAETAGEPGAKQRPEQFEIEVEVKNTGRTQNINGYDTKETVIAITAHEKGKSVDKDGGLALVSSMWLAPRIAALQEIADLSRRHARKLAGSAIGSASPQESARALAMYPGLGEVLVRMKTEDAKLEGSPIRTTTTVEVIQSAEEVAQRRKQQAKDSEVKSAGVGVGGLLGGIAAKAVKNKIQGDDEVKQRATIMTMTDEVLRISNAVSAADLAIPAGFRRVQ